MTKELYNGFYKKYGVGVHTNPVRFRETAKLCKGRVLDVGCGTGDLADFYLGKYLGVDISDIAIKFAKESRRKNAQFKEKDLCKKLEGENKEFDTVVIAEVLEHIDSDEILFENIKKLAKDNARIIISVPNGDRVPDENHLREFTVPSLRKRFSELGKVKFYNWLGERDRILMSVDMGEKNHNDLTLSMMVKDEGKGLERAILSSIEFVDSIVVSVDNNTTDESFDIAMRYADVLKRHEWENDFSKVRNFVDEGITSKYILSLDGHEFVEKSDGIIEKLKQDLDAFMITVKMERGDTFVTPRIYRKGSVWKHAIHNSIKAEKVDKFVEFIITHDREGGQSKLSVQKRMQQVKVMMKEELEKELKVPECRVRALFYLARYYRQWYDWKKAIKYYKKYLWESSYKGEKWLCCYEAGILANALGKHLLALKFFNKANKIIPNRWEIKKHIGITYLSFGRYQKGVKFLVESMQENTGEFSFNPEIRNTSDTWDKIGFCFFMLKEYSKAKTSWERAIEIGKDEVQNKLNRKRIELLEREHSV